MLIQAGSICKSYRSINTGRPIAWVRTHKRKAVSPMKKAFTGLLLAILCCIVAGCSGASFDESIFELDYESDQSQEMDSERASLSKLKSTFNWLDSKDDEIYQLTYQDVAKRLGCHASTYSNRSGTRGYTWLDDQDESAGLGVYISQIDGVWVVSSFTGYNLEY